MATWNELFLNTKHIAMTPQPEVYKFIKKLEIEFDLKKLRIWDLCCGAGRHTVMVSSLGHEVYGSDISENGINHTKNWLDDNNLKANLLISDMAELPWNNVKFHGAFSWDALHHNTINNISKAVDNVQTSLLSGGMFMTTLISTKGGAYRRGIEIEHNTFVREDGDEAGVPHHYFDEMEIRSLFSEWTIVSLVEQVMNYIETEDGYYETNPFPYTKWGIIARKR